MPPPTDLAIVPSPAAAKDQVHEMEISSPTTVVKPNKRLTSVVWNDFERVKKGDVCVAVCKHCKKKLSGSSTSGTSHLRNHLKRCRKRTNHDITQLLVVREKKKDGTLDLGNFKFDQEQKKGETFSLENYKFDPERSRLDLVQMIILHGYPLAMVEHIGFKMFVKNLQPLFNLMNCSTVEADCMAIYGKEKQKMYEVLDKLHGRISLIADMWVSCESGGYLCLTAHYIDGNWQMQKRILNFVMVDPSHTEDILSEVLMTCLMDWDIDRKLIALTLDDCSTNDNFVFRIRDRLTQNKLLLSNGQLFDVRCAAHILNLIVQDALDALRDVTEKIRESIRYVKSSQARQEKFNEIAQQIRVYSQKSLCIDSPMRWISTYLMLEVALEYKDVFSLLREHDPAYKLAPSDLEWGRASAITNYLKLFFEVTNNFSSIKHPTANLYFPEICDVHLQLIEWCKSADTFISGMALKMKSKFDKYWNTCSLALAMAAILDPRFKMKLVEYYYPQIYGSAAADRIKVVSDNIKELFNDYAICSTLTNFEHGLAWEGRANSGYSGTGLPSASNDRLSGFDKFLHETSNTQRVKSDLDKYLEEPVFPRNVDFSILNWWKVHTPRYPILSMMARDVLGIPMATVPLGSTFNAGGRILDPYRSSLSPDILQALICTQDWLRTELEETQPSSSHAILSLCLDTT
ncbi:zinc finger BED domain-containing protein RICESLEEPER 1-like isoform X1 [Macadamia integrifolia]|uniref:zinc finger BED domain-containing protein RICESLEEPER 1-like isoform X1 n=2 Tax=Macadamia integrifolia TaxID=60698 RepID=UPI001C4EF712|nr:zinc finger BED domain-containing protein RICESLEEPER 1-like isoform X1 [Macadamia integrifolia]XP_042483828.1 zinc finger BED domain-containing protein RICESLEEPER 1-like isoform X1 [Macadamia integrifolia]XP_042483829.1 zinc finger BED domain-containing protein RICESLEEPER 1-like isoform X1 [Macadamia integrifolia]XP_042483830.1 zinc finger BED domain-containing protein RICESLEEPER 1-like isoform X1 [Macadamia integrifolia]